LMGEGGEHGASRWWRIAGVGDRFGHC
jgi:hypothetical protein